MKKFLLTLPIILLATMILTGCSDSILRKEDPSANTTTLRLDNSALSIDIPFDLKNETLTEENLGEVAPYIKKVVMKSADESDTSILIIGTVYDKNKIEKEFGATFEPDLEGALQGAVRNLQNVQNTEPIRDIRLNGLQGKEINGTLKIKFKGDSKLSHALFRMAALAKGSEMWMVCVIRKPGDDTIKISNKIFKSIHLD